MQYRELYNLTILHDYYEDGNCADFRLLPTPACKQILRNYRLIIKQNEFGLKVLAPFVLAEEEQEDGSSISKLVPFLQIPPSTRFTFWLYSTNARFGSFTDFNSSFLGKTISNPVFTNAGAGLYLSAEEEIKFARVTEFTFRLAVSGRESQNYLKIEYIGELRSGLTEPSLKLIEGDQAQETNFDARSTPGTLAITLPGSSVGFNDIEDRIGELNDEKEVTGFFYEKVGNPRTIELADNTGLVERRAYEAVLAKDRFGNVLNGKYDRASPPPQVLVVRKKDHPHKVDFDALSTPGVLLISIREKAIPIIGAFMDRWNSLPSMEKGGFSLSLEMANPQILKVEESQIRKTDQFLIPKPKADSAWVPLLLKQNPLRLPAELLISNLGQTGKPASFIKSEWDIPEDLSHGSSGFAIEKMGTGSDRIEALPDYVDLHLPFSLDLSGTDDEGGSLPGVFITYHGLGLMPRVKVEAVGRSEQTVAPITPKNATFSFHDDPPSLTIYVLDEDPLPTWQEIVTDWIEFVKSSDAQGFRMSVVGDGSATVLAMDDFTSMSIGNQLELILPFKGRNGLLISYKGEQPEARIMLSDKGEAPQFEAKSGGFPFEVDGPVGIDIVDFQEDSNTVFLREADQAGQALRLIYLAKPKMPWGVFGQVDIHASLGFTEIATQPLDYKLALQFQAPKLFWKYYVVVEKEFDSSTDMVKLKPTEDEVLAVPFYTKEISLTRNDVPSWETIRSMGANLVHRNQRINSKELRRLWKQIVEAEGNLKNNEEFGDKRFLFVSRGKIPLQNRYTDKLTLQFINADIKFDENPHDNLDEEKAFDLQIPLLAPTHDHLQVIRLKQPAIVSD